MPFCKRRSLVWRCGLRLVVLCPVLAASGGDVERRGEPSFERPPASLWAPPLGAVIAAVILWDEYRRPPPPPKHNGTAQL